MTIKSPARSALRIPYLAVRTPLGLLDEQVVVRVFGVDSTAHRSLARGLHTLDALAAAAFASPGHRPPDARSRAESEGAPDEAPEQETDGATVAVITDVEPVEREGGEQPIDPAEQDEIEQLTDTFLADDAVTPHAGELAENEELRRVQAEIRAKQAIETEHGQI